MGIDLKDDMRAFPGIKEDPEVIGALVRKLSEKDRLQEALSLLDEAASAGLRIRERNIRELRGRLLRNGMAVHPLIGPDPEGWRQDAAKARRSKKKKDGVYLLKSMLV